MESSVNNGLASSESAAGGRHGFATTHWSEVLLAGQGDSPRAEAALEKLCRAYWYPLYAHIRRRGHPAEHAKDLTQEFFASLFRHDSLAAARRDKGRFRSFLLGALDHFLADQADRTRAAKRNFGQAPIELDALDAEARYALEPATDETPDRAFDRRWAATLIERAIVRLAAEQAEAGQAARFERLKGFLGRDIEPGEYETLSPSLDLSANAIAAQVRRLRLRCRELTLAEVAQTVMTPTEAEAELRQLFG